MSYTERWLVCKMHGDKKAVFYTLSVERNSSTYRQRISLFWFKTRELGRAFGKKPGNHRKVKYCFVEPFYEHRAQLTPIEKEFTSVFEFYEHIGYDRKAQRYRKPTCV